MYTAFSHCMGRVLRLRVLSKDIVAKPRYDDRSSFLQIHFIMSTAGRFAGGGHLPWPSWLLAVIFCFLSVDAVKDIGVPSKTSKWCSEAMTGVNDVPKAVKPLMIFLCTLHAGGVKTFEDVGFCMDTVKLLCLHE